MPAFMLLFAGIFIGLIVGGVVTWLRQGKWRKQARQAQVHDHASPSVPTAAASSADANGPVARSCELTTGLSASALRFSLLARIGKIRLRPL
jgi:hypothetical protein